MEVGAGDHFNNGIRMSKWGTNYAWKKLREKVVDNASKQYLEMKKIQVDKTDWKRHSRPAVVNAFYSSIENSIQVFFVHPTFMNIYIIQFPFIF